MNDCFIIDDESGDYTTLGILIGDYDNPIRWNRWNMCFFTSKMIKVLSTA